MSKFVIFLMLFVIFAFGSGKGENRDFDTLTKRSIQVRLCGEKLYRAIIAACGSLRSKRSAEVLLSGSDLNNSLAWKRFKGVSVIKNFYKRGGSSDDCCLRPCSFNHLLRYCQA